MNKFDHIRPPKTYQYRSNKVLIKNKFQFVCDNRIYFSETAYKDLKNQLYHFNVEILSPIDAYGLALDFNIVDKLYDEHIAPYLDKQLLNDTLPEMNTTAENITFWLWEQFDKNLSNAYELCKIEFFENDRQGLVLKAELMK
ncbi:6-carboxytetrahydropterin synthase [Staphylococcus sp. ACRSN]|uniref:6-pyruvoyl trahydropterin synthase family protein n=1 Tax=Staphylococcus sp. ACRSN TaxID=2918214 RepID=UPI001EF1D5A0|nr:6-carboxytetrahydropterin synthase [Staphylococcus sp. ACRSN]MCG7339049.1 6-carboxytetrahydropterin synthase [Staphylococcus sp. ACRSN]